jgi:2-dehydropantoate 2-reductase
MGLVMAEITILGGGSLGLLLAGRLAASGCDCVLWTRTVHQASLLGSKGLIIQERDDQSAQRVRLPVIPITEVSSGSGEHGVVLLTVKQTALTSDFLLWLADVIPAQGALVLFQNGVGHMERLQEALPGRRLIAALTTEGALRIDETTVRHTGQGVIRLGADKPEDDELLSMLERMLKQAGFSVLLSKMLEEAVLQKLLINAVINPLTAILRIRNGELTHTPERIQLMQDLHHESFRILSLYGLQDEAALWETLLQVCRATSSNESSMLQDINLHKETEIDFINGAICRMAIRQGLEAPWNKAVVALVKAAHSS